MNSSFEAPGPGQWDLDRSHYPGGITPISEELMRVGTADAYRRLFAEMGVPADTVEMRAVNGFTYTRVRPLLGADSNSTRTPPALLIKLIAHVHPEFRRRTKRAEATLADPGFAEVVEEWRSSIKPRLVAANTALQDVDLGAIDDQALADHLARLVQHLRTNFQEHHRLHGYDLGPLGQFVVAGKDWGFDTSQILATLVGASPSTTEPLHDLFAIQQELDGAVPASLEDLRAHSPRAAELADRYLARHGSVLFAGYDLDTPTLRERPDVFVSSVLNAAPPRDTMTVSEELAQSLRAQLASTDHAEFDELLANARAAMDMRDDNGPITVEWPAGLLRLAMLEAGSRLVASTRLHDAEHIFEATADEVPELIRDGSGPTADEFADRASARAANRQLDPPVRLGPLQPPPPLDALPDAPAQLIRMVNAITEELGMLSVEELPEAVAGSVDMMRGAGIGAESFTGIARNAVTAEQALSELEDGEILVTRVTSPAFNLALSIAGGIVTADGGPMSHAAVLARELGLPAVIGARGCIEHIASGDRVEIDPTAGTVRVLERPAAG